jgi:hypothetical protein
MKDKNYFVLAALFALFAATGCGGTADTGMSLEDRVLARWNYLMADDFQAVYDFATPGFRQTMTREEFAHKLAQSPVKWEEVQYVGAECEGQSCLVQLTGIYRAIAAPSGLNQMRLPREISERWIEIDGEWWRVES